MWSEEGDGEWKGVKVIGRFKRKRKKKTKEMLSLMLQDKKATGLLPR